MRSADGVNKIDGDRDGEDGNGCIYHREEILLMAEILHHLGCMKPYK